MRKLLFILSFALGALAGDYTRPKKYAEYTVEINAPIDVVWAYNANNDHARQWSTYFYKIKNCPLKDCPWNASLKQSEVGYTRRCFRRADEQGTFWDETTTKIEKGPLTYYKQIRAYNFNEFMSIFNYNEKGEFLVEQIYKKISDNKTSLTFRSGYIKREELEHKTSRFDYFMWQQIFHFVTKRSVENTFRWNLANIKAHIENGDNYKRVYDYTDDDSKFY